jgi:tripartite-type tricarboxylate transporter receptor subunit TctC
MSASHAIGRRGLMATTLVPAALLPWPALAAYPDKPIRLVIGYAPGGMAGMLGPLLTERLTSILGQPVVLDFRPGANGMLGAENVAQGRPDGYSLLMAVNSLFAINPLLNPSSRFRPAESLTPIGMVMTSANLLFVNGRSGIRDVAGLIEEARANPGKLSYGSSGIGSSLHLSGELFKQMAGVDIAHVPYRGAGPALTDLVAGNVSFMFADTSAMSYVDSGALRAIAVTSAGRMPLVPQIPTVSESGLPGFAVDTWYSLAVANGTPAEIRQQLNAALRTILQDPELRRRIEGTGSVIATDPSPDYVWRRIREDSAKWRRVVEVAGLRVE